MQIEPNINRFIDPGRYAGNSMETIRKFTSSGIAVTANAERKADSIFTFTYAFLETRVQICAS